MEATEKRPILDACCGSRMFWFDKNNPNVDFIDIRQLETTLCDGRKLSVKPDIIADFTNMPFEDKSYKLVVFDPPHLNHAGQNGWQVKKYGSLPLKGWEETIRSGITECMRVLDDYGVLIFKWNEQQIKLKQILEILPWPPLFGHTTTRNEMTHWMCFIKLPNM